MNSKPNKLLLILLCFAITVSGCEVSFWDKEDQNSEEKISREATVEENEQSEENEKSSNNIIQDVEVYEVGDKNAALAFTKTGTVTPFQTINILPEISGKIVDLKIKEGEKVNKGELIAELGDSLNTDSLALQYQSALNSLSVSKDSKKVMRQLADQNIASANESIEMANDAFTNSVRTKQESIEMLWHQRDSLQATLANAENGVSNAYENLSDAKKMLKDAEDTYYEYTHDTPLDMQDPTIKANLDAMITSAEAAVDGAEIALEQAQYGRDQAEYAFLQFDESYDVQTQGLAFGVESAESQKNMAKIQRETAEISKAQQLLSADAQIIQAESAVDVAELTLSRTKIYAPIDGVIADIFVEESEFANPGQPMATIETDDKMIVKTSVNEKERDLLEEGDTVIVSNNEIEYEGKITEISASLDNLSRKIEVEIEVNAPKFTAGSLVDIEFQPESNRTLFVPLNSVFILDGEKNVKVVNRDDTISYQQVKTGLIIGNFVEIKDGLDSKDLVVTNQSQFLDEGETINPIEYEG